MKLKDKLEQEARSLWNEIRMIERALRGLPLEEDVFNGLINIKSNIERARLSKGELRKHTHMRMMAMIQKGERDKAELDNWEVLADLEDVESIATDGKQWDYAVQMITGKKQELVFPLTSGQAQAPQPEQKKLSFWQKGNKED